MEKPMGTTLKRSLIVGIIIMFLSTTCLPVLASEELPDLIIEDLVISPGHQPGDEEYWLKLKNIGNASTPSNKGIDITVTVRWKIFGILPSIIVRQYETSFWRDGGLAPGDTAGITFTSNYLMPFFGFYWIYCKINPYGRISESNTRNNAYTETVLIILKMSIVSW
jgi:hypothetical protein